MATKNSKNCLTCTFCIRNQNTWHSVGIQPLLSKWVYKKASLTSIQRGALKKGDDSFIEKEIREVKAWDDRYEEERNLEEQRERELERANPLLGSIMRMRAPAAGLFGPAQDNAEKYGLPPRPEAPDDDYLSCFHEQWDESKNAEIQKQRKIFLENKKCSFHFPFQDKGNETLEACEKNRKSLQESRRFLITNILIVASILVTIIIGLGQILLQKLSH